MLKVVLLVFFVMLFTGFWACLDDKEVSVNVGCFLITHTHTRWKIYCLLSVFFFLFHCAVTLSLDQKPSPAAVIYILKSAFFIYICLPLVLISPTFPTTPFVLLCIMNFFFSLLHLPKSPSPRRGLWGQVFYQEEGRFIISISFQ